MAEQLAIVERLFCGSLMCSVHEQNEEQMKIGVPCIRVRK
jgi:hypothetical protein